MDTIILRIKLVHQSCVDTIGVLLKEGNVDGLSSAASTVAGTATGFQERDSRAARQADSHHTLKECAAGDAPGTNFGDNFVYGFTLLKDHVSSPLKKQTVMNMNQKCSAESLFLQYLPCFSVR